MKRRNEDQFVFLNAPREGAVGSGIKGQTYFVGTRGNDHLVGGDLTGDYFNMSGGGDDIVEGLGGDDLVEFADSGFNARDRLIGGEGRDGVLLRDNKPLTITGQMMSGFETVVIWLNDRTYKQVTIAADVTNEHGQLTIAGTITDYDLVVSAPGSALDLGFYATGGYSRFSGGNGDDFFVANENAEGEFDGGGGRNRVSLNAFHAGVTIDLAEKNAQLVPGGAVRLANIDDLSGTQSADTIKGNEHDNVIQSYGGNDILQGFAGDDLMMIGSSDPRATPTKAYIDGGTGFDTLALDRDDNAGAALTVNLNDRGYQDTGLGTVRLLGVEGVSGTVYDDAIAGGDQKNTLYGNGGNDTLNGQGGADILYGDSHVTVDSLLEFHSSPQVVVSDTPGADLLKGGSGNDFLYGEGGNDWLAGGLGADRLWGGDGADIFLYTAVGESRASAVDTIADFTAGDRIDVSPIDPDTALAGDQAFHLGTTVGHTGDILVAFNAGQNVTSVTFYVDGDARPDMLINLTGNIALTAADFIF